LLEMTYNALCADVRHGRSERIVGNPLQAAPEIPKRGAALRSSELPRNRRMRRFGDC